jgi:ABC-type lipoprotein export system ATPase subunit
LRFGETTRCSEKIVFGNPSVTVESNAEVKIESQRYMDEDREETMMGGEKVRIVIARKLIEEKKILELMYTKQILSLPSR